MCWKHRVTSPFPCQQYTEAEMSTRQAAWRLSFSISSSLSGPESGRITQYKHQTMTVGATLVQLIYYHVLLGSAITATTDCSPQTWCLVVLKKHRQLWMCKTHLLLKYCTIRFCSQKDYAISTSQWMKSPSREKVLISNMYLFSFSGFCPCCYGR